MPWYYKITKNTKVVLDKGTERLHCAHIIADLMCKLYLQDLYGLLLPECYRACNVTYTTKICSNRVSTNKVNRHCFPK